MTVLGDLAYQITYGAVRAYLDACRDNMLATVEKPTDEDKARADRFRAAIATRLHQAGSSGGSDNPTSGG